MERKSESSQITLSNREFRSIYRKIMGDTKAQVNIRQAYTILNCAGKNVLSLHLKQQWKFLDEKISVDRLYDIYVKTEDLVWEAPEFEKAVRTKKFRIEDVLAGLADWTLVNKQYLEIVLQDHLNEEGFVDVGSVLEVVNKSKVEIVNKLLAPSVEENQSEFVTKARGYMTIQPKVQCTSFTIHVDQPTFCELFLSLAKNSDVPPNRFENDLFVVVFNEENLVGLTRHVVADSKKFATGIMKVSPGDEVMILAMGTTIERKRSTTEERAVLIEESGKASRRYRYTLMNNFDAFDVNQDGVLSFDEMNFYTVAGQDDPLTEDDWQVLLESFPSENGGLTVAGFIGMHETEAADEEGDSLKDLWHTLNQLGYDSQLCCLYGCSYDVEVKASRQIQLIPRQTNVRRQNRNFILEHLYEMGEPDDRFEICPHIFKTDYFGLLIAKREDRFANASYRVTLSSREHIRVNFPHQVHQLINFGDSDCEYVLIASYTVTDPNAQLEYTLERVEPSNSNSPSLRGG